MQTAIYIEYPVMNVSLQVSKIIGNDTEGDGGQYKNEKLFNILIKVRRVTSFNASM